jgi:hypothetical protein
MASVPWERPLSPADAALAYLRRRKGLLVRLARVEGAHQRWGAWETNALPPEDPQRRVTRPGLTREDLEGLHRMLTEELARLDGRAAPAG